MFCQTQSGRRLDFSVFMFYEPLPKLLRILWCNINIYNTVKNIPFPSFLHLSQPWEHTVLHRVAGNTYACCLLHSLKLCFPYWLLMRKVLLVGISSVITAKHKYWIKNPKLERELFKIVFLGFCSS